MTTSVKTKWTKSGTQILKDGTAVFLNGVCYSPTPCGAATYEPGVGDWFHTPWNNIWERDFPLMKAAGIDNIRTYFFWAWSPPANMTKWSKVLIKPTFDHSAFLAAAAKHGISVTIGIALDGGNVFDNAVASKGKDYLDFYKATAKKLAEMYGDNPAVMGFCIGNEQNNPTRIQTCAFWDGLSDIASEVKTAAPDKLVMLAMQNDNPGMYTATVGNDVPTSPFAGKSVPYCFANIFDVWGVNIYSGMTDSLADYNTYVASTDNKLPLIISEWGIPAATTAGVLTPAEFTTAITNVMDPRGAAMKANVSFVAGAQYFEWTDEWWKGDEGKTPAVHTNPTNNQWTEEWWGLNSIAPTDRTAADGPWQGAPVNAPYDADTITARPTLAALTTLYSGITPA